ncbi:MAG: T9SS type A sorting domain-containing protein [Salibacteraceae bacterium]
MKITSLLITLCFTLNNLYAQDWKVIGEVNLGARVFSDSVSDLLYVYGAFHLINSSISANGIATWDGNKWATLDLGVNYDTVPFPRRGTVSSISRTNEGLVFGGYFEHVGYYQKSKNVALWNTDSLKWETMDWNPDGSIDFVLEQNDTTFVLGTYDSIGGVAIRGTSYLHQNQWINMSPPDGAEIPKVLVPYQNSYYLGGNMNSSIPGVNDIARWDGLKFQPVGTGVDGGFGWVNDMVVYKNELYIGGSFTIPSGHAGDYIMKWDGQQYHNIGNFDYPITDFKVHKGVLYASGLFDYYEGVRTNQIAWYEPDIGWHALSGDDHDVISGFDFYHEELYAYRNYNGKKEVIKYQKKLPTSIETLLPKKKYSIYPNPSSTTINIKGLLPTDQYLLTDVQGKVLISHKTEQLDISNLNSGIYFIHIHSQHHYQTLKFIKQ